MKQPNLPMEHYLERLEVRSKNGERHITLICGVCRVVWPCIGKQLEIRNRATTEREIQESDSGEHTDGGSSGKVA